MHSIIPLFPGLPGGPELLIVLFVLVLLPGGLFLAMALVSFRWVTAGGYALLGTGIVVLVGYPLMAYGKFSVTTIITVLLMIALPPLLAGAGILYGNSPRAAEPPPDRR